MDKELHYNISKLKDISIGAEGKNLYHVGNEFLNLDQLMSKKNNSEVISIIKHYIDSNIETFLLNPEIYTIKELKVIQDFKKNNSDIFFNNNYELFFIIYVKNKQNITNKVNISFKIVDIHNKSKEDKKRSCFVNIIHSFDSQICIKTRYKLLKKKIKSLSIHDCFLVNIYNSKECIEIYNKELSTLLNTNLVKVIDDLNDLPSFFKRKWLYHYKNESYDLCLKATLSSINHIIKNEMKNINKYNITKIGLKISNCDFKIIKDI